MKKRLFPLSLALIILLLPTQNIQAQTQTNVEFFHGLPSLPDGRRFMARNPLDPRLPFPANEVYKESNSPLFGFVEVDGVEYWGQIEFDLKPSNEQSDEETLQIATNQYPKLFGERGYLVDPKNSLSAYNQDWNKDTPMPHAGIVHVPFMWNFGKAQLHDTQVTLQALGSPSFYTDIFSHIQTFDNRFDSTNSTWTLGAKLLDWPTNRNGNQLIGATIFLPSAIARNEFNEDATQPDKRFLTHQAHVSKEYTSTLWETKSKEQLVEEGFSIEAIKTRGVGMSTLTWQTNQIELHIPTQDIQTIQAGFYAVRILWSMTKGPSS
ncbi:MAG: hypothetical protein LBV67_10705 [Streptococcaceae bacterium]|nr:hypothetical protein [Streptococcaceae bacterium]